MKNLKEIEFLKFYKKVEILFKKWVKILFQNFKNFYQNN